jgi:hypothetical protein
MTKLNAGKIHWIKASLCNDEYASDEELVAYFIKNGPMTKEQAKQWVDRRMYYMGGNDRFQKMIAVLPRQQACFHCAGTQIKVILYPQTWWLECVQCGDIIPYEEQRAFSLNREFLNPTGLHPVGS